MGRMKDIGDIVQVGSICDSYFYFSIRAFTENWTKNITGTASVVRNMRISSEMEGEYDCSLYMVRKCNINSQRLSNDYRVHIKVKASEFLTMQWLLESHWYEPAGE